MSVKEKKKSMERGVNLAMEVIFNKVARHVYVEQPPGEIVCWFSFYVDFSRDRGPLC